MAGSHGDERAISCGTGGRLGVIPKGLSEAVRGRRVVWLHAVSVGEVMAASELVRELRASLPGWVIAVSTTTETGQRLARERFAESPVFYMPLDFVSVIRRYLDTLHPNLVILMESELWPNLMNVVRKTGHSGCSGECAGVGPVAATVSAVATTLAAFAGEDFAVSGAERGECAATGADWGAGGSGASYGKSEIRREGGG